MSQTDFKTVGSKWMVPRARLELARRKALAPKTSAATNYATSANFSKDNIVKQLVLNLSNWA